MPHIAPMTVLKKYCRTSLFAKGCTQSAPQVCTRRHLITSQQVCISSHADMHLCIHLCRHALMYTACKEPAVDCLTLVCQAKCCVTARAVLLAADRNIWHRNDANRTAWTAQGVWPPSCVPCCRVRLELRCWGHFECHRWHAHQLGVKQMASAQDSKPVTVDTRTRAPVSLQIAALKAETS